MEGGSAEKQGRLPFTGKHVWPCSCGWAWRGPAEPGCTRPALTAPRLSLGKMPLQFQAGQPVGSLACHGAVPEIRGCGGEGGRALQGWPAQGSSSGLGGGQEATKVLS